MTNIELRNTLGLSIFFGQLSLVIAVLFSPFYGVDFPDSMSLLTVVAPVLGAYTVVVARHFTRHRHKSTTLGRSLSWPFVIIALSLPIVLYAGTLTVFLSYALGWWNVSLESTRFALTSLEGLFALYLGAIVDTIFR